MDCDVAVWATAAGPCIKQISNAQLVRRIIVSILTHRVESPMGTAHPFVVTGAAELQMQLDYPSAEIIRSRATEVFSRP